MHRSFTLVLLVSLAALRGLLLYTSWVKADITSVEFFGDRFFQGAAR